MLTLLYLIIIIIEEDIDADALRDEFALRMREVTSEVSQRSVTAMLKVRVSGCHRADVDVNASKLGNKIFLANVESRNLAIALNKQITSTYAVYLSTYLLQIIYSLAEMFLSIWSFALMF